MCKCEYVCESGDAKHTHVIAIYGEFEIHKNLWTGALALEEHKSSIRIPFGSILTEKNAKNVLGGESF
jgi:hypothetical protein